MQKQSSGICRDRGVLLVADEVICRGGRLRQLVGNERYDFTPDLMTCTKGISHSNPRWAQRYTAGPVREAFWRDDAAPFVHGGAYAPGVRTGASQVSSDLDILERERLVERVATLEPVLSRLLAPLGGPARRRRRAQRRPRGCGRAGRRAARRAAGGRRSISLTARNSSILTRAPPAGWRCRCRRRSSSPRTSSAKVSAGDRRIAARGRPGSFARGVSSRKHPRSA